MKKAFDTRDLGRMSYEEALSIQEFVKRIEISMDHLRTIAKDGYVDSVSNILIKALNNMAITERPLHCTDLKRETVYIKNNETWNKSTADEPLMNGLINTIENKTINLNVPASTQYGATLRIPKHGMYSKQSTRGDLLVQVLVKIPENLTEQQLNICKKLRDDE